MTRRRHPVCLIWITAELLLLLMICCSPIRARRYDVQDISRKQLESLITSEHYLAVFWYSKNCKTCDRTLAVLETKAAELTDTGIRLVKLNDRKTAKQFGVLSTPGLTYFKAGNAQNFESSLEDEEAIMNFLASPEAMELPDQIEEVKARALSKLVLEKPFVAVVFFNYQPESIAVLDELEQIDQQADKVGIAFVKINDLELVDDYGLDTLPALVFFRHTVPIIFQGDLANEQSVLEWLISNRSTGEDDDQVVEEVTSDALATMISSMDTIAVLFYDPESRKMEQLLDVMETIDDDLSERDIPFVKIADADAGQQYGIQTRPALVFFKGQLPNLFEGNLLDGDGCLQWVLAQFQEDSIEKLTGSMLEKLIAQSRHLVVLFYRRQDEDTEDTLSGLESIDDDLDRIEARLVKTADPAAAEDYGLSGVLPALVYFDNGIPFLYDGDVEAASPDSLLHWLEDKIASDTIEDVNDEMLDKLLTGDLAGAGSVYSSHVDVAVLFYEKGQPESEMAVSALEKIDDDCDIHGIILVKIDDLEESQSYGIDQMPSLVYFENTIPYLYEGDLLNENEVLGWLIHQMKSDEIEKVTGQMIQRLTQTHSNVASMVYEKSDRRSSKILSRLEIVDDDAELSNIVLVKFAVDSRDEANTKLSFADIRLKELPSLILFVKGSGALIFDGDLGDEEQVLHWMTKNAQIDQPEALNLKIPAAEPEENEKSESEPQQKVKAKSNQDGGSKKASTKIQAETGEDTKKSVKDTDETQSDSVKAPKPPKAVKKAAVKEDEAKPSSKKETAPKPKKVSSDPEAEPLNIPVASKNKAKEDEQPKPSSKKDTSSKAKKSLENAEQPSQVSAASKKKAKVDEQPKPSSKKDTPSKAKKLPGNEAEPSQSPAVSKKKATGDEQTKSSSKKEVPKKSPGTTAEPLQIPAASKKKALEDQDADQPPPKKKETASKPKKSPENMTEPSPTSATTKQKRSVKKEEPQQPSKKETPSSKPSGHHAAAPAAEKPLKSSSSSKAMNESGTGKSAAKSATLKSRIEIVEPEEEEITNPDEDDDDENEDQPEELSTNQEIIQTITEHRNVVVFFYDKLDKVVAKITGSLGKIEDTYAGKSLVFLNVEADEVTDLTVSSVPSIVYYKNGHANVYTDNMMNEEAIHAWIQTHFESNQDIIEDFSTAQIQQILINQTFLVVFVYQEECELCEEALTHLEDIDDDTDAVGVRMVKTDDPEFVQLLGIQEFPSIIYFENQDPHIYDGDPTEESELLTWILYQMKEDTIENINRDLLIQMIHSNEFLGVFFYTDNEESSRMLRHLELIDDEALEFGVKMVKLDDSLMAKKYGHRNPPGLGFFRKGNYIKYDGDEFDEEEMLDWLTDPNVMEVSDQIEKVNRKMFDKIVSRNEHVAVYFYTETDCKQCEAVLQELENIDDEAEAADILIIKLEDKELAKSVGVFAHPSVVFFRQFGKEAVIYAGDIKNEDAILEWLLVQKDPSNEAIEDEDAEGVEQIIESTEHIAVYLYSHSDCELCLEILQGLENIDDDADRQGIALIKTVDPEFAQKMGISSFPALIFFTEGIPNLYDGDLEAEEEVLDWLIEMKVESHIELVNRAMLEDMVAEIQYLAVFFFKPNCRTCDQILVELENIDDECDGYGIQMVKLQDAILAKRYGIKTYPSLVYFRNGNPLTFDGDLKDEESVLGWLVADDNRELQDEIEAVNLKMLNKLLDSTPFMAVFFYDEECLECEVILESLENIDEEADLFGINFVKTDEVEAARTFHIFSTPALVYFRKRVPVVYEGDLTDEEDVLNWLTSQDVFEIPDEIEDVNRKMLEKILDENEFVAVFFYGDNCAECDKVLQGLEGIDQDAGALDISLVKINDQRYAKKYGVTRLPSLVYFRRKFPSIYRDNLMETTQVLDWLKRNRYKPVELHWIMYSVMSVALAFLLYTLFIIFGLKARDDDDVSKKLQ